MSGELGILSADFQIKESSVSPNGGIKQLCLQDPSRWALIISQANTGVACWISTLPTVGANDGVPLVINNPVFNMNFRDVGALVQAAWFGFGGAASTLQVIEVLYRPADIEIVTQEHMEELAERMKGSDVLQATTRARRPWA